MRKPSEIAGAFAPRESLDNAKRFFLVGIGGAGMSALARMLRHRGHAVLGTDGTRSPETDRLHAEGIEVQIGHSGDALKPGDAVILTDAIDLERSPEVARARELGVPLLRRSQGLGWLLRSKRVIAVTGTHGKTTTTGMIGAGLRAAERDPLIVVGANVPEWGSPVVEGDGEWAVVEACEAYDAFHDLDPQIIVLTNLELDHVDYHGTWENLRGSVVRFVERLPKDGWLIYCGEDRGASEVAELTDVRSIPYGIDETWAIQIANSLNGRFPVERLRFQDNVGEADLALPGRHNRLNGTGALMACAFAEADLSRAASGIAAVGGARRPPASGGGSSAPPHHAFRCSSTALPPPGRTSRSSTTTPIILRRSKRPSAPFASGTPAGSSPWCSSRTFTPAPRR